MPRIIDLFVKSLRSAAIFNPDVQAAPACILWPDRDRQWQAALPRLREDLPELLLLGEYDPAKRSGPAIWLRCAIAGTLGDISLPAGRPPILYLPGVSRQDLRAVETCPDQLQPLAELQYRGVIWSQVNGKDWTILAFLKSDQDGLGLDVAQDAGTRNAIQLAVAYLLDEQLASLQGKHLDKDFFNALLTSGDTIREMLRWLDRPEAFRAAHTDAEWQAFVELCKSQLAFDPQKETALAAAGKLAIREGAWRGVWDRFSETLKHYSNIPSQIRKCQPPKHDLLWRLSDGSHDGWPQWNEEQEEELRLSLLETAAEPEHKARQRILDLEQQHGRRRQLVWAELGWAHLAQAIEHLAVLGEATKAGLAAGSVDDLVAGYISHGWHADDAVVKALAAVETPAQFDAVSAAIRAVYAPWAEVSARRLQQVVAASTYPAANILSAKPHVHEDGLCIVFVDGLRFDLAQRLAALLTAKGYQTQQAVSWSALPSVTATAKAAVSPVRDKIGGAAATADFEPSVAATGQSLKGGYHFAKLLSDAGWQILAASETGDSQGKAWSETGNIDHEGHDRGWKLAKQIDTLLADVAGRVVALLSAGWPAVKVVTDHGWLLLPGGLPKVGLPAALVEHKWGRCAVIKPGATTQEQLYPWFWNAGQYFALADGISCFQNGLEYAHGGLSLQECLTAELVVQKAAGVTHGALVRFGNITWRGLRCVVVVEGESTGLSLDIRATAADPATSVVSPKPVRSDGTASVVVEDDDLVGKTATIVLVDAGGTVHAQIETVIGGGKNGA